MLGLDIGGTKLAAGVLTHDGKVHAFRSVPTRREEGPERVIRRLFDLGRRVLDDSGLDGELAAVGISCGGPLDSAEGVLIAPFHLPGWRDVPIAALTSAEFGLPAKLHNDATACALAEHRYGAGRGAESVLYLTISTGIGGGAVVGGRLMTGAAGNGGEFGHITVDTGGRPCRCGRRGCLEAHCSGSNIGARADEALGDHPDSVLAQLGRAPTAADVARAARAGDPLARAIWDETIILLGRGLTDLVNVFEPNVVVLGGGLTRSADLLLPGLRRILRTDPMPPAAKAVRLEVTPLGDANAVVGAGAIAQDLLTHRQENAHVR